MELCPHHHISSSALKKEIKKASLKFTIATFGISFLVEMCCERELLVSLEVTLSHFELYQVELRRALMDCKVY